MEKILHSYCEVTYHVFKQVPKVIDSRKRLAVSKRHLLVWQAYKNTTLTKELPHRRVSQVQAHRKDERGGQISWLCRREEHELPNPQKHTKDVP